MENLLVEFVDTEECAKRDICFPDVYLTPQYGQLVQISDGGIWEMAILRFADATTCYYAYLKRPIHIDGCLHGGQMFDLISPYGYGGPWAQGDISEDKWLEFRTLFVVAARNKNYISEFIRFSPLLQNMQRLFISATEESVITWFHQQTFSVDLKASSYLTHAGKRHKYAVNVARRQGFVFNVERGRGIRTCSLLAFKELYRGTMDRLDAASYYHFTDEYYTTLIDLLQDRVTLCTIESKQTVVAAGFFLEHSDFVHYHLSAANDEGRQYGATDLMLHEIARCAKERDFEILHLGGGVKHGDGLFNFKKSVGRVKLDWSLGKSIFDLTKYKQLVQAKAAKLKVDVQDLKDTGHFPEYRAGLP
uniref:BioF2-like acetyltransferase domain-containing protein n=1 Tax=Mantoniella antarctica TaxID=81844 RepID=A0A7S0T187_9CHLO|mmetsp:Transcript_7672/g.19009  ORF Transcript_7672/g.19009 Transcript_7672/m.19009 type:complete len:362 (+) Transcript_7672:144-1229(+)